MTPNTTEKYPQNDEKRRMRWQAQIVLVGRTYSSEEREKNNWRLKMLTLKWQSVTDRERGKLGQLSQSIENHSSDVH